MNITKFNEKLNKLEGNTYTIEEVVTLVNGVYEADLRHDNVEPNTINIYSGSKLTGDKINSYTISTPSLTPWRTHIKIYSSTSPLYITYETIGDTVEADDINNVQNAINDTQNALNNEITRATKAENTLQTNISNEVTRATKAENTITSNLNNEITRAKNAEKQLQTNIDNEVKRGKDAEKQLQTNIDTEITRATNAENTLTANLNNEVTRAKKAENTLTTNLSNEVTRAKSAENGIQNIINTNKPKWDDKYTKAEIDNKIDAILTDTVWKESVANFADIATTYPNPQAGWTVYVEDTGYTYRYEKGSWVKISTYNIPLATSARDGRMSKEDKSFLDSVKSMWTNITTHIADTVKHITSAERTLWNTVSNKADKSHTHTKSQITDMPTKLSQFTNDKGFITSADVNTSQNHMHSNKTVLDEITQNSLDSWNNKFDKTGGVVTGKALFKQGTGVIKLNGGSGTVGFMHVARIKISNNYQNQPITFSIHQRNGVYGMLVIIFKSINGIDPDLQYIHKIGNMNAYIYKSDTSTWELYLQKVEAYDCIDIIELNKGGYMDGTAVTWIDETVAALPTGNIQATTEYLNVNVAKATQDSDGKQINTTYVKKGMTWAELEGK